MHFANHSTCNPTPETHFNLAAAAHLRANQIALAETKLDKAIELRPYMGAAYRVKGQIHAARRSFDKAIAAFKNALTMDPGDSRSYQLIIKLFKAQGNMGAVARYRELAGRAARRPDLFER
ncbi:MAG: hypothetical protein U5O39_10155 [Gammaproteobacteria bacterium]|nr:hypothetical protein [Gammaproteobacteria bacterium]